MANSLPIVSRLRFLRQEGELCDSIFIVGPEKKEFKAHKLVLSIASEVFKAMFYGPFQAPKPSDETLKPVEIPDVYPEAFNILLRHAYGNETSSDFTSVEVALRCIYAANKYMMKDLTAQGIRYIDNRISIQNSCHVYQMSLMLDLEPLSEKCTNFILRNSPKCLLTDGFTLLGCDVVKQLIRKCQNHVDAKNIFKALLNWAEQRSEDTSSKREKLVPFLEYIRFLDMSPTDFFNIVASSGVLFDEEIVSISFVLFGMDLGDRELPQWCNRIAKYIPEIGTPKASKRSATGRDNDGAAKKCATSSPYNFRKRP